VTKSISAKNSALDESMKVSLATEMAPPFILVAHFFIAGILFLTLSGVALLSMSSELSGYIISSSLAAFSHLYLLGFVMMIIFGAMYQLLPVVLEAPIFSKDFAYVQFYMYVVGFLMMVSGFSVAEFHLLIPYGAVVTYLSMLIFCFNVFLTFYRLEKITLVGKFLLMGTIFLFISVSLGLLIGLSLGHGLLEIDIDIWVKAHIVGTLGGFVMMIVMGVSMVLIPMFSLSHNFGEQWIKRAFYLHSFGVALMMIALIAPFPFFVQSIAALCMVLGVLSFVVQIAMILKKRVRKQNDYWVKNILFALVCLVASVFTCTLYFFKGVDAFGILSGVLFFFGFLLSFIVGHIYKILPFLIWYEKFSPLVGKQKVPLLHQMIHTKMADLQTWMLFASVVLLCGGVVAPIGKLFFLGSVLLLSSLVLVALNAFYAFNYKIKE
jgi:hypothetical protein